MEDFDVLNKSLQDFAIAYKNQAGVEDDQRSIQELSVIEQNPRDESELTLPISIPHLALHILKTFRRVKNEAKEELSKEDNEFLEVLEEVIHNFPKWTVRLLGEKIRIKLLQFLDTNGLELSVNEKNKIYGNLGNIAFGAYLTDYKHSHPFLNNLSNDIKKSCLLGRIDFMLKLMKYDKNDLEHISSVMIYMSDTKPITLTSDYIDKAFLIKDFDQIQGYVDWIKSKTEWNNLKAHNFFSDLLNGAKLFIQAFNYSKELLEEITNLLEDKGINKTTTYVFLNDTLYPFIGGLKSEEEILLSISNNNDATTQANINRRKKRAVDNILSRKG